MRLNLKGNTLGFILQPAVILKGFAMDDPRAIRDKAYAEAEAAFQETKA